jgi:hypothetical protein
MVSVLPSSVTDRGFENLAGQSKDKQIGSCCFSAKRASLRSLMSKDWLDLNPDNVPERATCLPANCCFSDLTLQKSTKRVGTV